MATQGQGVHMNFMVCKRPLVKKLHENEIIMVILMCPISSIAHAKHGCMGGWLIRLVDLTHWPLGDVRVTFKFPLNTCCGKSSWARLEIALRWMSQNTFDDKPSLVRVMAWCRQAASHYLSQCWLRAMPLYGVTRPQWVNERRHAYIIKVLANERQFYICNIFSHWLRLCWDIQNNLWYCHCCNIFK